METLTKTLTTFSLPLETAMASSVYQRKEKAKLSALRDEDEDEEIYIPNARFDDACSPVQSINDDADRINGVQQSEDYNSDVNEDDDDAVSVDEEAKKSESLPVVLTDPDLLDCFICFNPLTVPVFQCERGHTSCSSCCTKLKICPTCQVRFANNRCLAIEKVIESVTVSCGYLKYGCKEMVIYCKKHEHEEICIYAPCSCPYCKFQGSPISLSQHIVLEHKDLLVRFRYDSFFPVFVGMDEKLVLQEEKDGMLFILSHGNTVNVRSIDPSLSKRRFAYDIALLQGDNSLNFQSLTRCIEGQVTNPPVDYFLVPGYFHGTNGRLKLDVCIRSKSYSKVSLLL